MSAGTDTLGPGERLSTGEQLLFDITGAPGEVRTIYWLSMQSDGNLVLYSDAGPEWASDTVDDQPNVAVMQDDGNFVVYGPDNCPRWASGTEGHLGAYLILQADGNLVIYDGDNAVWATGTVHELFRVGE